MEHSICWPDAHHRKVCCPSGAWIKVTSRRIGSLVHSSDYYHLLMVPASSNEVNERRLRSSKRGSRDLEWLMDR